MKRFLVFSLLLLLASAAVAETTVVVKRLDPVATKSRWTPEALASAKPMPLPRVDYRPELAKVTTSRLSAHKPAAEDPFDEVFPSYAEGPTLSDAERAAFRQKLFDFTEEELRKMRGLDAEPAAIDLDEKNFGSAGLNYTSSRLIPSSAVETFPYSAVGKLFFSDSEGGDFVCSAAVITKRLVLTAGHCVHDGPVGGFFEDFLYVPAYLRGDAPYGSWTATAVFVTDAWADSGEIPHRHDFALLVMADQAGSTISDVTGKISFLADNLADNHLTLLGYPGNLDSGEEMHQITSGDYVEFLANTVVYGSDMSGGSSGGPWCQNFNRKAAGQGGGRNRARAAVVGVTSYGFNDDAVRAQGASILTRDFKVLRQQACFDTAGNC